MYMKEITRKAKMTKKLVIIGGGAAGLMAACAASKNGIKVTLVEHTDKLGKKLAITGKGRCNVTNNCPPEDILKNTLTNRKFLYSSIYSFTPDDVMAFFEEKGVELKTERGNRVFPVSDKAYDVVNALVNTAKSQGVDIIFDNVEEILTDTDKNGEKLAVGVRLRDNGSIYSDCVLLATGGKSYPVTGSDGSGYRLAKAVGHSITELRASLIPIYCKEKYCADMMGLSLKNVVLSLWENAKKKPVYSEIGEMLFTHFGVSGPLVLSASSYMQKDVNKYHITIDLKPGLDEQKLDTRILRDFSDNINKDLSNVLGLLLPRAMIIPVIRLASLTADKKINTITKEERLNLIHIIKHFPLTPTGFRPIEEAIVTGGGVCVREIDASTMESRLCKGLYFAGEVIDVDAFTGGFNLQIAFSTAINAVNAMLEY